MRPTAETSEYNGVSDETKVEDSIHNGNVYVPEYAVTKSVIARVENEFQRLLESTAMTHQMGSVNIMINGLLKLTLNSGRKSCLSSYRLHHLSHPVSFLRCAALFLRMAGA